MNQIKIEWLVAAGIIVGVVAVIYFLVKTHEETSRSEIDKWLEQELARALAEKLHQSTKDVLQALQSKSDDELTAKIREMVDSAQLTFTRASSVSEVEIRLNLDYKNGTSFSVATNWDWDRLPEPIRSEFLQTGRDTVSRPWLFL
ncbi:MAG: hypothetical protein QNJ65_12025 [Xenococcaceae cyanobacterium MO_234.B1]|nr:hypothetical protein [Xenococcaceae cyanobacterium MO_234.B1]